MGLRTMVIVTAGGIFLCGIYSGLDIKYGVRGFICWSAFCLLATGLGGGTVLGSVAAALLAGGWVGGLEPYAVLLVSLLASKVLCSTMSAGQAKDDVQVKFKPYEEEIRELLFQNDPSRLHLVDAELQKFEGREKQLLRKYKAEFDPAPTGGGESGPGHRAEVARGGGRGGGGGGGGGGGFSMDSARAAALRRSVVEQAREEEARRVQATLEATLQRVLSRKANRR